MIDWITAVVPCAHRAPIRDGCFQKVAGSGEVEWSSDRRMTVKGSFDSAVQLRTATWEGDCTHVEVSGNIAKFFQGHNLWGTDDLPGLLLEFMVWLSLRAEDSASPLVSPTCDDLEAWRTGAYSLHRVDVTDSYTLRNRADVLAWLRAAEQTAHLAHRGRGQLTKGSTLYFGKASRRWALKLYSKGQEIEAHGSHQPALANLPSAHSWADNVLRAEIVIRGMELKRIGLGVGTAWLPLDGVPFESLPLLRDKLGAMTMTTNRTLSDDVIASLTSGQHTAYLAWLAGNDLRDTMSRPSFYRLRSKLLPHGVDIATLQPSEDRSNVVPLVRVLEAVPAQVPSWAIGTPLYFEPRRVA
jgi:II/X family phage/plasmid replication protein